MRVFRPSSIVGVSLRSVIHRPADKFPTEQAYLDQDLPDPELEGSEPNVPIPGDSFGIAANRKTFIRPSNRYANIPAPFNAMFRNKHPQECVNPAILRNLCSRFGLSYEEAAGRLLEANMDPNLFLKDLEDDRGLASPNSYGLVAMEKYDPETFCLLSLSCPNFESTRNEEVLEAIHEVVLSAAEIPIDCPRNSVVDKLMGEWTTEGGELCGDILRRYGLGVVDCVLLPFGDYSAQGFAVHNPVSEDFPNIGTGASASCLDLRTGIHSRFRFHVERIADSICDHAIEEAIHFGQWEHILRQSYWFKPSYSVEEFIRFKERLLQPSANLFELRYALLLHPMLNLRGYRNIVEMEKLQIQQHRFEKNTEEFAGPDSKVTSDHNLHAISAYTGDSFVSNEQLQTKVAQWQLHMKDGLQKRDDRLFGQFYTNHYF